MSRSDPNNHATRFKKGQSGNPKGRPAQFAQFREECRKHSPAALAKLVAALTETILGADGEPVTVHTSVGIKAAETLLAYGWGKPTQVIEADLNVNVSVTQVLEEARRRLKSST